MKIRQLLRIFQARKLIFNSILSLFIVFTVVTTLLLPKTYVGEVSVVVNAKGTDAVTGGALQVDLSPDFAATQIDIITSHNVAKKVVEKLSLYDNPDWQSDYAKASDNSGDIRDWIADKILKKLKIYPSRESKVITITFPANEARIAADTANAFADAYIQTALEIKLDPARRQAAWFSTQLSELRRNLEKAQINLANYQRKNNIVGQEDVLDVESTRLANLSTQLANLQAESGDAQSRVHQLNEANAKNRVDELVDVLGNPLLQSMKVDLVRAEGKLSQTASRYDKNHPEYISAATEVETLREKLKRQINTVKGSIVESSRLSQQRESEMRNLIEAQKQRILSMKESRYTQDVLAREVSNAQQTYDQAVQRASQLGLESRLDESNIAILNHAIPPTKAKWPKPLLNLTFLATIIGSMIGLTAIIISEIFDRRIRSKEDISEILRIPVLGEFKIFP